MLRHGWTNILLATLLGISAFARAQEQAVTRSPQDPQLQWGPCPAFMPPGCGLTVLHGDPSKPNADVFLRIPANTELAEHWHSSAERMVLVAGELAVRYQKQAEVVLRPGMYVTGRQSFPIPPRAAAAHRACCSSHLNPLSMQFRHRRLQSSSGGTALRGTREAKNTRPTSPSIPPRMPMSSQK